MRLCAIDLGCHRGGRDVFAGLSFTVSSGEALTITGRNGAGKSSLLRTIVGLARISHGNLTLEGGDPELNLAEQAHYLGHHDALKPSLSVGENLRFWATFLGASDAAVSAALEAIGLEELTDLPAAYLSAGQRRRLSIARLLAVKRPIWLLDEPTSTLDTNGQNRLADLMQGHLNEGGLVMAATHTTIGLGSVRELQLQDAVPAAITERAAS